MTTKGQLITLKSRISIFHPVYRQVCKRIINGTFFRSLLSCSNSNFTGCFFTLINIFFGKKLHFTEVDVSEKENNSNNIYDSEITNIAGNIVGKNKRESAADILDLYGNDILRLAYSYLHNLQDSEDILQETLIRYIQKAPAEIGAFQQKAWLLRVASNLCKDRIRYKNVHTADELKETLADEKADNLSFVWDAVKTLPVKYREVIHLFYYEGYSTKEISTILERKESTIRSDLRRGRQQLKNILKEEYDFE